MDSFLINGPLHAELVRISIYEQTSVRFHHQQVGGVCRVMAELRLFLFIEE